MLYLICWVSFISFLHILTLIPSQLPHTNTQTNTSRSLIVNGCPTGGGENMITPRLSLPPQKKLEQPGASNTAQQLLGLRTELKMVE